MRSRAVKELERGRGRESRQRERRVSYVLNCKVRRKSSDGDTPKIPKTGLGCNLSLLWSRTEKKLSKNNHLIIDFPVSLGVSEWVSEQTSECCKGRKRVAQCLRLDNWLFWAIVRSYRRWWGDTAVRKWILSYIMRTCGLNKKLVSLTVCLQKKNKTKKRKTKQTKDRQKKKEF